MNKLRDENDDIKYQKLCNSNFKELINNGTLVPGILGAIGQALLVS